MKIGIFDPYLDTLGGGEKYILSIAACLAKKNQVNLFWNEKSIFSKINKRFSLDLRDINLANNIFSKETSFTERLIETRKYDLIFYVSDGSIPTLFSKKNILIFQFPVNWVNGKSIINQLKLKRFQSFVCYSDFVKKFIDKNFSVNSIVLPPAVDSVKRKNIKKEKIILTVGRFTKAINAKKQDFLIGVFKKMCDQGLSGWKFLVIGSALSADMLYVEELREKISGYPIEILDNASFKDLINNYNKAKIYWHATGFGEDLEKHPERAEHFGISTVEAMSAGEVPVVINAGGQPEIVDEGKNGLLWSKEDELIKKTRFLIDDEITCRKLSLEAIKKARIFEANEFCKKLTNILG